MKKRIAKKVLLITCIFALAFTMSVSAYAYVAPENAPSANAPIWAYCSSHPDGANVRSGPSTAYNAVASLQWTEHVEVRGLSGDWTEVCYQINNPNPGYVFSQYITPLYTTYLRVAAPSGLNMREGASTGSALIMTVPNGRCMPYHDTIDREGYTWYHVLWGRTTGCVAGTYVNV